MLPRRWIASLPGAIGLVLVAAAPLPATNEDVRELWDRYIKWVGCRDEMEVLNCYDKNLRKQLSGDNTAAGRARLDVHMADLFEILQRDWDHKLINEKDDGRTVTYKLKFKKRADGKEYETEVVFVEEDDRWWISRPPDSPNLLSAGKGTIPMIAGIVIAIGIIAFIGKKLLG